MITTHLIGYFYPSSFHAQKLKMPQGGWSLRQWEGDEERLPIIGFATYADALAAVPEGSVPGRWSIDHPANAHHYPHLSKK